MAQRELKYLNQYANSKTNTQVVQLLTDLQQRVRPKSTGSSKSLHGQVSSQFTVSESDARINLASPEAPVQIAAQRAQEVSMVVRKTSSTSKPERRKIYISV